MRKAGHVLFPIIVYFIVHDLVQMGLYMAINYLANHNGAPMELYVKYGQYAAATVQSLSMLLGAAVLLPFFKEVSFAKSEAKNFLYVGGIAAVMTVGLNVLILKSGLVSLSGSFSNVSTQQAGVPVVMGILLFGIVSPVVEEYIFRGLLQARVKSMFPTVVCMVVSALFFGVYHGNLVQGIYGFLMGLVLAWAMEWSGNLLIPIFFHMVANLISYLVGRLGLFDKMPIFVGIIGVLAAVALIVTKQRKLTTNGK